MEKTTVRIKTETHQELKEFCKSQGLKIGYKADQIIQNFLASRKQSEEVLEDHLERSNRGRDATNQHGQN